MLKVPPSKTLLNALNGVEVYAENAGDGCGAVTFGKHTFSYLGVKLAKDGIVLSALAAPVMHILKLRTTHKMVRVHADRIIASVTNYIGVQNRTVGEYVSHAMRKYFRFATAFANKAVAVVVPVREPRPAIVGVSLDKLTSEAGFKRGTFSGHSLLMGKHLAFVKAHGGRHR